MVTADHVWALLIWAVSVGTATAIFAAIMRGGHTRSGWRR